MRKILFSSRNWLLLAVAAAIVIIPLSCKRENQMIIKEEKNPEVAKRIEKIKNWWEASKSVSIQPGNEVLSRIPDGTTIQSYWSSQFQNGIPKWSNAQVFTIGDETIYEVPFQFPDNLVLLNDKPDAPAQPFITGKAGEADAMKPSRTFLIVKERGGATTAEVMCVVFANSYLQMLDSTGTTYPDIRIQNVYPAPNNLRDFTGSVKFYDPNGVQLLEEGYSSGNIFDYIEYGRCNFPITPHPNLSTTRMYQVCTWTYVYQQNCSADAGCTDWELIGVIFNGCETIVLPDSPPVILPGGGGGSGGGGTSFPPPPSITPQGPKPGARLCGNYTWKTVGDAVYAQIRNLGATAMPNNPGGGIPQTFTLGLTCVHFPKWYVTQGWDITEFVNRAYNMAAQRMQDELNSGALPPAAAILQPRFEEYMRYYLKNHPNGSYHEYATIVFRNGCDGPIPVSEPKWCYPQ